MAPKLKLVNLPGDCHDNLKMAAIKKTQEVGHYIPVCVLLSEIVNEWLKNNFKK